MKYFVLLALAFSIAACGQHEQTLERYQGQRKTKKLAEAGPIEAVESGNLERLKRDIEGGLDVNAATENGVTLLMLAVKNKQFAIVDYLLGLKADLEIQVAKGNDEGKSVFDFVGELGEKDFDNKILNALLKGEGVEEEWMNIAIFTFITLRNPHNVAWLVKKGVDVNFAYKRKKATPLIALFVFLPVIKQGDDETFQVLLDMFNAMVSRPDIDVNVKVGSNKALKRCKRRAKKNNSHPGYKVLVERLKAMGAT